jgi:hypothetical protein
VGSKGGGGDRGGEMTQALYAHMNNKTIKIKKKNSRCTIVSCLARLCVWKIRCIKAFSIYEVFTGLYLNVS